MKPLSMLSADQIEHALSVQAARMWTTHEKLVAIFNGAGLDRDKDLREYVTKLRNKIMVEKQRWLTQNVFTESPRPLFYVEGTSKSILLNYIPCTDANVYVVSDYTMLANYTHLRLKLLQSKYMPGRAQYVVTDLVYFDQDVVSTRCAELAEKHADKIAYFQLKYK